MSRSVRFLTRDGCALCEEALPTVVTRVGKLGWWLEIVDVDEAGLDSEFGDRVPVVQIGGVEVLSGRFDRRDVKRALR